MAYLVWHKINKKSWIIMILLGGHVLRSPGRFTSSLWSWSRCQMKDTLEIFIILKDWVLSVNRCLFTSRWSFPTLKMWFPGSNFGLIFIDKPSSDSLWPGSVSRHPWISDCSSGLSTVLLDQSGSPSKIWESDSKGMSPQTMSCRRTPRDQTVIPSAV